MVIVAGEARWDKAGSQARRNHALDEAQTGGVVGLTAAQRLQRVPEGEGLALDADFARVSHRAVVQSQSVGVKVVIWFRRDYTEKRRVGTRPLQASHGEGHNSEGQSEGLQVEEIELGQELNASRVFVHEAQELVRPEIEWRVPSDPNYRNEAAQEFWQACSARIVLIMVDAPNKILKTVCSIIPVIIANPFIKVFQQTAVRLFPDCVPIKPLDDLHVCSIEGCGVAEQLGDEQQRVGRPAIERDAETHEVGDRQGRGHCGHRVGAHPLDNFVRLLVEQVDVGLPRALLEFDVCIGERVHGACVGRVDASGILDGEADHFFSRAGPMEDVNPQGVFEQHSPVVAKDRTHGGAEEVPGAANQLHGVDRRVDVAGREGTWAAAELVVVEVGDRGRSYG